MWTWTTPLIEKRTNMPSGPPLYAIVTQDGTVLAIRADKNAAHIHANDVVRRANQGVNIVTDGDTIRTIHDPFELRIQTVEDICLRTD